MLTYEQIKPYLSLGVDEIPNDKHGFYDKSIKHKNEIKEVFGKEYPAYLNVARPREQDEFKDYRKTIYQNLFSGLLDRVIKALDFIQQTDDFEIVWNNELESGDTLKEYTTQINYSKDGSFQAWFFKHVRPAYVKDPNAVLVILPELPEQQTERANPRPYLIPSERVYQHKKGKFAVLESGQANELSDGRKGKVLFFVDEDSYTIAKQVEEVSEKGKTVVTWQVLGLSKTVEADGKEVIVFAPPRHYCEVMPAVKVGRDLAESNDEGEEYYQSLLTNALAPIRLAQETQLDIQVERNFHIHSQEWRYETTPCPDASKTGEDRCIDGKKNVRDEQGRPAGQKVCNTCKGNSYVSTSALGYIGVRPPSKNDYNDTKAVSFPTPPGGFIPRNIESLKAFVEEFERYKTEAYQEINMQFLQRIPENTSGYSKRFDREEHFKELSVQGSHLCALLSFGFQANACQRFQGKIEDQVPNVLVPVRLSLDSTELTWEDLEKAKKNGFHPSIIAALEEKLLVYQCGEDSEPVKRYRLIRAVNPFPSKTMEELMFMAASVRSLVNYNSPEVQAQINRIMFAVNLEMLITICALDDPDFWDKKPKDQLTALMEENKKYVGTLSSQVVDAEGNPTSGIISLSPLVDIKNVKQL